MLDEKNKENRINVQPKESLLKIFTLAYMSSSKFFQNAIHLWTMIKVDQEQVSFQIVQHQQPEFVGW